MKTGRVLQARNMSDEQLAALLDSSECEEILKKFNQETNNNLQFKSYTIVVAADAKGFLGEYFHLIIQCMKCDTETQLTDDDADLDDITRITFFIKNMPPANEDNERVKIFHKESSLYCSLLPKLQNYASEPWCPKVYLCRTNLLVLEYLHNNGLYSIGAKEILRKDEMLPVLNGLAAMHASSLLYEFETNENIGDLYRESLKEVTVDSDVAWFTTGLKAIINVGKNLSKFQTDEAQKFIAFELPFHLKKVYFMVDPSSKYRNVVCHRDTWGGNIFLHPDNVTKPAVFVDFQTCRYSPPAIDVILTLFMNLTKKQRLEEQSVYIKFYYQQLIQHIKNHISSEVSVNDVVFSEEEFLKSIDEFILFGFVYRALAISILRVPRELVTDSYKNKERSEKLLNYMEENEQFFQMMNESVEDIIGAVADILKKQVHCLNAL